MSRRFSIISAGPGHNGFLTARARLAIEQADFICACGRIAGIMAAIRKEWKLCPVEDLVDIAIEATSNHVAVVISGDVGFFENINHIVEHLQMHGEVTVYPGISSVQYLCAQIGESYDDIYWAQESRENLLAAVAYHQKVCVLIDENATVNQVCERMMQAGLGELRAVIGMRLATGGEQIIDSTVQALCGMKFAKPAILLIFNAAVTEPHRPLFDKDFVQHDAMKMHQEVRWNAVSLLDIRSNDTVAVLGAECEAISMDLARKAFRGGVITTVQKIEALRILEQNRNALGCWNIELMHQGSLEAMSMLTSLDAAFIGVDAGGLRELLSELKTKNSQVRVVIAADSLERLSEAQMALSTLRFKHVAVSQLMTSHARTLGKYTMMLAGETMFFISAGGREKEDAV